MFRKNINNQKRMTSNLCSVIKVPHMSPIGKAAIGILRALPSRSQVLVDVYREQSAASVTIPQHVVVFSFTFPHVATRSSGMSFTWAAFPFVKHLGMPGVVPQPMVTLGLPPSQAAVWQAALLLRDSSGDPPQ